MGRASDRILGACLLVVRGLMVAAVLAIVAGTIYLLAEPGSVERGSSRSDASATPTAPQSARPPAAPPAEPLAPLETRGTTALVRRLEVGHELNLLRKVVERDGAAKARFEERYRRVEPFLLAVDRAPEDFPDDPVSVLRQLTEPRRDLARLVLSGARADDPLGASLRVRAWTLGEPYPADELARVTRTIDHIVRHTGRDVPQGIDVLVTPEMGSDVFPFQRAPPWAAGVYFGKDRYCAVLTKLPRDYRPEVLEHECIHALCNAIPSFSTSRFVTEGLAEYLRLVHPDDPSLAIPRERFAHQLARLALLLERLETHGVDVHTIDPRRLVDLSPQHFYALRGFGYVVAQVTMAYVGGDVIEQALGAGSDDTIVAAVRAIPWPDFLAFVREGAKGGNPVEAMIVEDAAEEEAPFRRDAALAGALRAIGAGVPHEDMDPVLVGWGDAGALGTEERVVAVLQAFGDPATARLAVVACTLPKEPACSVPPVPDAITAELGGTPSGETPWSVGLSLAGLLQKRYPRYMMAKGAQKLPPDFLRSYVERAGPASCLVFIVGTGDTPALARVEIPPDVRPANVLVVDLSTDGEAINLAQMHDQPGTLVAYWRLRLAEK